MAVNENQVRTFLAVARCGSMTHAAQALYVTQPAVKKQLDSLESELGARLLERTQKGCVLTEAGAYFAEAMARIGGEVDAVRERVRELSRGGRTLRMCVLPHGISPWFEMFSRTFVDAHPEVELVHVPMAYAERPDAVAEGRADVAIYFEDATFLAEKGLVFWNTRLPGASTPPDAGALCLMDRSHPLAGRASLAADDLRDVPVAVFDEQVFRPLAAELGKKPSELPVFSDDMFKVLRFCGDGGIYLCRHLTGRYETLVTVALDYPVPPEGVISRPDPPEVVRWFVDVVRDVLGHGVHENRPV